MTLTLPKGFKEFYGPNINKMPVILKDKKRSPMSVAEFMKARLMYGKDYPNLLDNYSDSSDLVAYSDTSTGKVKFVFATDKEGEITRNGRTALKLINPKAERVNGAVILGDKYEIFEGVEVPVNQLGLLETRLTREQILNSKVWRMLARHPDEVPAKIAEDAQLLPEYVDFTASQREARKWTAFPMMGVYIDSLDDKPKLRAFYVNWLEGRSNVNGRSDLDNDFGRLVGLAPEARAKLAGWKPSQNKAEVLPCTLADWTEAEKQYQGLTRILQASQTDKIGAYLLKSRRTYQ